MYGCVHRDKHALLPMKKMRSFYWIVFALTLAVFIGVSQLSVAAQERLDWSKPQRIPGYDPRADIPFLIADQNRTVHAFNSVWLKGERVIVYSKWILGNGWTRPVDLLLPQIALENRLEAAFLDEDQVVHLIFFSGDEVRANIFHTKAPLMQAGLATAWSQPKVIGEMPLIPDVAAGVLDGNGRLLVLFGGTQEGQGLYFTYSVDSGDTWSAPTPFSLTFSDELWPSNLKMYVDPQNNTHAVWSVANETGNSETLYYANLENGQIEWNTPLVLASATNGEVDTPSIINYDDTLFVIYHDDFPTTRYMLQSVDGGQSWTGRVRLFPHIGSNGPAYLVIDNENKLHMFFGNRLSGPPDTHGLWHSVWLGNTWSTPEAVVSGPNIQDQVGTNGFDPSFADGVLSQGNSLLVTWRTDPQAGPNGIWYSYALLETPELPIATLPAPTRSTQTTLLSDSAITSVITTSVSPALDSTMTDYQADPSQSNLSSPVISVILGILPAICVIVFVLIRTWLVKRQ